MEHFCHIHHANEIQWYGWHDVNDYMKIEHLLFLSVDGKSVIAYKLG